MENGMGVIFEEIEAAIPSKAIKGIKSWITRNAMNPKRKSTKEHSRHCKVKLLRTKFGEKLLKWKT